MEGPVPNKLEEWVAYEDQKRLAEWNLVSDQYFPPDHRTQTWALLGTPTIEPSQC